MGNDVQKPTVEDWKKLATEESRGKSPDRLIWNTAEGIAIKPLYTAADTSSPFADTLPALLRLHRGPKATMYAGRPGQFANMRAFLPLKNPTRSTVKPRCRSARCIGRVRPATHRGYDSDHHASPATSVKRVAIDSVEDMKILFDQIPLDKVSVSMTMNGAVLPRTGNVCGCCRRARRSAGKAFRNDPERHSERIHGA